MNNGCLTTLILNHFLYQKSLWPENQVILCFACQNEFDQMINSFWRPWQLAQWDEKYSSVWAFKPMAVSSSPAALNDILN